MMKHRAGLPGVSALLTAFTVSAIFAASLLPASIARAERTQIWIASGLAGGTYQAVYANNLGKLLRDYDMLYRPSTGSGENLDLLVDGKADIAFTQADVYAERLTIDPNRYGSLLPVGKLADECVYIAYRRAGPVTTLKGLGVPVGGKAATLALGAAEGGMSGTWSYLKTLDASLAGADIAYVGDTLALNQLALGAFDAVGWVTDPMNFKHKMLRAAMENDALGLMNLDDPALVSSLPDGTRVYEGRSVKLTGDWRAPKINTICTSALLVTRKDANPKLIDKLADVLSLNLDKVVGRQ
jgi:TRAP-type uncharacterized transport system substrate-binding protein